MRLRVPTMIAGLVVALAATGCGSSPSSEPSTGSPVADQRTEIEVVASTNVWGSVVQAVGGDAVRVASIITDPAADPHLYENKPENAILVAEAKLLIYNGGGYDDFFARLADGSGPNARRIVTFDISGKGASGSTNEHVWYDLPTVKKVAGSIAAALGEIAPDQKDSFARNATSFTDKLDELTATTQKIGQAQPGATVAYTEPIAEYLLEAAGLTNVTPAEFAEAIEEATDPPAAAIAEMTGLITGKRVKALIYNVQTESPVTKQIREAAERSGIPVVEVTETLPAGATNYLDWMTTQVNALAAATRQ